MSHIPNEAAAQSLVANPLKRSAFFTCVEDTSLESRPPSRSHTQKKPRHKEHVERPIFITDKGGSIQLKPTTITVEVMLPRRTIMERRTLDDVLGGWHGERSMAFSILCFISCTFEHLESISQVITLLHGVNTSVFGVSLTAPPPDISSFPIIHDTTRSLTLNLGLMHPLGGGRQCLDAIVVLDHEYRRRLLLPVRMRPQPTLHDGNNTLLQENSMEGTLRSVVKGIEWLAGERQEEIEFDVEMGSGSFVTATV